MMPQPWAADKRVDININAFTRRPKESTWAGDAGDFGNDDRMAHRQEYLAQ